MSLLCDVNEPEETIRVGKFIGGLREHMREKLEVKQNLTFENACNSSLTYEKYAKKKITTPNPIGTHKQRQTLPLHTTPLPITSNNTNPRKPNERQNAPMKDVVCFKCHGHGHYRNECLMFGYLLPLSGQSFKERVDLEPC